MRRRMMSLLLLIPAAYLVLCALVFFRLSWSSGIRDSCARATVSGYQINVS